MASKKDDFTLEETSLKVKVEKQTKLIEQKRRALLEQYKKEDKVAVTVSPMYAPYLGRVVRCSVNSIMVEVPADGRSYKINKTHASHIISRIKKIDEMLARQSRAGEVYKNFENTPGELHI